MYTRLRYTPYVLLLLLLLTACQDDSWQDMTQTGNSQDETGLQDGFLHTGRGYETYTLPTEFTQEWNGCHIKTDRGFIFLSDSTIKAGRQLTIEVEQNPFEEVRRGNLLVTDDNGNILHSLPVEQASSTTRSAGEAYSGALMRSYGVGYGYDAFGEYASYNSVRDQIISLPALRRYEQEHHTAYIIDDHSPDLTTSILEGNDSEKLLKSLSAEAGLGLDVGFFQAHAKVGYASSDLKQNQYSFCTIMNNVKMASRHIDPLTFIEIARKDETVLTEGFRYMVRKIGDAVRQNNMLDAQEYTDDLFRIYGTHFIYHADLGGKLEFCSTFERASLDSKTKLSAAAEATFLKTCGFKMETGQENTYSQVQTRQSNSLYVKGGDVTCTSEILNSETDVLADGVIDRWYKSVKIDFSDPKNSNAELINFKLYPVYQLVTDAGAAEYIANMLGEQIEYENSTFPKAYNRLYTAIPTSMLTELLNSGERNVNTVNTGNQAIGEIIREEFSMNGKRYQLASFYPTIAGEVLHEGFTANQDSLYLILWKDNQCTLKPIIPLKDVSTIYNNDGDLAIEALPEQEYTHCSYNNLSQLTIYNWDQYYNISYRIGPYTAVEAASVNNSASSPYYHQILAKDTPPGWEVWNRETMDASVSALIAGYTPWLPDTNTQYHVYSKGNYEGLLLLSFSTNSCNYSNDNGRQAPLLLVRTDDFRY